MLDLVVVGVVALAAFAGWRRGFIAPVLAVTMSLVGLYAMYAGPGQGIVPTGAAGLGLGVVVVGVVSSFIFRAGSVLVGLVHRVSLFKAADRVLGIPMGAATGLVAVYVALLAVVSFDTVIAPLHGKATVDQAAVAAMRAAVAANPQFSVMLDPGTLDAMATQVATAAIPADQVAKINETLGYYESTVRPHLRASAIAPTLLSLGERLPFIGRHVEFPTK